VLKKARFFARMLKKATATLEENLFEKFYKNFTSFPA